MNFKENSGGSGKIMIGPKKISSGAQNTYCFPFYTMLLALNRTHIDYFSLDVEGLELDVLKTIPFDKVDISVFTVEYIHVKGGITALTKFMESKRYITHSKIQVEKAILGLYAYDLVFVKKGLKGT